MILSLSLCALLQLACTTGDPASPGSKTVPHEEKWGIYALDLATEEVELVASSPDGFSTLRLNSAGDRFVFSRKIDGGADEDEEICSIAVDGGDFRRLTDNEYWDLYPCWSPDGTRVAFLSWRWADLDLYVVDASGGEGDSLYDSGSHDADVDWSGDRIAFTTHSQIWTVKDDGTNPTQITDPPNAGEWGDANLPFGDYDPRFDPGGTLIAFERLVDDESPHGNYDIYSIDVSGFWETPLTDTGYSQGFASWSHAGDRLVYVVAAIGSEGRFDLYMMNADGSDNRNITPDHFPADFLCHFPCFSLDDSKVFFVGEWWE
jgi:TolB protein